MSDPTPLTAAEEAALTAAVEAGTFTATAAADLIVADSGTGKTTLGATMALEIFRRTGKITRFYSYDSGGFGALMVALIQQGIVEVWRVRTRDPSGRGKMAIGTCHLASVGCWPISLDPRTGVCPEGVQLAAPTVTWIVGVDKSGQERGAWRDENQIPGDARQALVFSRVRRVTPGFERVGGIFVDGLTSMDAWAIEELNVRSATENLGGVQSAMKPLYSGGVEFGSAGMSGIGFIQQRARNWANGLATIPYLERAPLVTALKQRGENQTQPIYGPKIGGKAMLNDIPSWFGNCFGLEAVPMRDSNGNPRVDFRLYTQPYSMDGDPAVNLVKNRANDPSWPLYIADPEGATLENGLLFSRWGMHTIYELLDQSVAKNAAMADRFLGGRAAPGIGSGQLPAEAAGSALGTGTGTSQPAPGGQRKPPPPPPGKAPAQPGSGVPVPAKPSTAGSDPQAAPQVPAPQAPAVVAPAAGPRKPPPPPQKAAMLAQAPAPVQTIPAPASAAPPPPPPPVASFPRPAGAPPAGGVAAQPVSVSIPAPARRGGPPPVRKP